MLKSKGHNVTVVTDGLQAFIKYKEQKWDIIIMDHMMPNMDGLEATNIIRQYERKEKLDRIPIIALSANAFQSDVMNSINAGCDAHISKPIDVDDINTLLRKYIKKIDR